MLGVCNNAVYINFFEEGRIQYLKALGMIPSAGIFTDGKLFFMVRNEADYYSHAYYDDVLEVYNRICRIGTSSFSFHHVIYRPTDKTVIVEGGGVVARVDSLTRRSTPLDESFIRKILAFEGDVEMKRKQL